jgi:ABC-type transporter Mla subunit MlaD
VDALQEILNSAEHISSNVHKINDFVRKKTEEVTDLDEEIAEKQRSLGKLSEQTEQAKKEYAETVEQLESNRNVAEKELERVAKLLEDAKNELKNTELKHNQFIEYQIRAEKALKAKDDSLMTRQLQLEEDERAFKRRNSVLNK